MTIYYRQFAFMTLTLLTLVLRPVTFYWDDTIAVPGWHTTIGGPNWNLLFMPLYFLLIVVLYSYKPQRTMAGWYFWLHFLLSLLPIAATSIPIWKVYIGKDPMSVEAIRSVRKLLLIITLSNFIFYANQLIFVIVLLVRNWRWSKYNSL